MKSLLLVLLTFFVVCAAHAAAQAPRAQQQQQQPAPNASEHLYKMGEKSVSIPPPEGFVEATSRSEEVKKFFEAAEVEAMDMLAVHVPSEIMAKIERHEYPDFEFYTKVSVSKSFRDVAQSQDDFSKIVAYLRENNAKVFDFKSPEMQSQLQKQSKSLSELLKEDTRFDLSQPVSLGEIESTPDSFGLLLLTKVKFQIGGEQKEKMLVSGASAVRVKSRLVWIYTYKVFNTDKDSDILKDFTKRWLADILRANKE